MSNLENKKTVLKLYRKMLYTLMDVFSGDYNNFHLMRISIRREIEKNENITDSKDIRQKIFDLEEARKTISTSLIQGKLQEGEFYRYKARPELFMGFNTEVKEDIFSNSSENNKMEYKDNTDENINNNNNKITKH